MKQSKRIGLIAAMMIASGTCTCAQTYPSKPIRLVTAEAGGSGDFAARLIAPDLVSSFGQPLIIDNRGGVATIPAMIVANAPADGHTILVYTNGLWTGPLMEPRPYDVLRDFAPVITLGISPNILVVNAQLPVRNVKELISLARAKPGTLNYATGAIGGSGHLASELFKSMAALDMVRVGYKGANLALNAVISGEVQLMFPGATAAAPQLKSGRVRALAVTSATPSVLAPGVPTMAAAGLPGYESVAVMGVFAPRCTPATIITILNAEFDGTLNKREIREKLLSGGLETVGRSPQHLGTTVKAEIGRLAKLIKDNGIRPE